jgi:hypothetical protein
LPRKKIQNGGRGQDNVLIFFQTKTIYCVRSIRSFELIFWLFPYFSSMNRKKNIWSVLDHPNMEVSYNFFAQKSFFYYLDPRIAES